MPKARRARPVPPPYTFRVVHKRREDLTPAERELLIIDLKTMQITARFSF